MRILLVLLRIQVEDLARDHLMDEGIDRFRQRGEGL